MNTNQSVLESGRRRGGEGGWQENSVVGGLAAGEWRLRMGARERGSSEERRGEATPPSAGSGPERAGPHVLLCAFGLREARSFSALRNRGRPETRARS
jgi:hypothetical protein